jgi:hypothetical protein
MTLSILILTIIGLFVTVNMNDIKHKLHNDTQHNDTQHNDIQHNDTQHNDIQHKLHTA